MAGTARDTTVQLTDNYLSAVCSVKSMSGELLVTGKLSKITRDYLEIINPSDRLPLVPYNTTVHLSIIKDRKPSYFGVGRAYVSTDDLLRVVEYADVNSFERRNAFRVPLLLKGKVWLAAKDGDEMPDAEEVSLPIEVRNLSLTGIFFLVNSELQIGQKVKVMVNVNRDYFLLTCRVHRTDQIGDRKGFGCAFEELSRAMADKLCAYLFQMQGEQIRKAKGR